MGKEKLFSFCACEHLLLGGFVLFALYYTLMHYNTGFHGPVDILYRVVLVKQKAHQLYRFG